jgi:hypothetical protein
MSSGVIDGSNFRQNLDFAKVAEQAVEMEVETVLVQATIQEPDLGTEQVGHLKEEAT